MCISLCWSWKYLNYQLWFMWLVISWSASTFKIFCKNRSKLVMQHASWPVKIACSLLFSVVWNSTLVQNQYFVVICWFVSPWLYSYEIYFVFVSDFLKNTELISPSWSLWWQRLVMLYPFVICWMHHWLGNLIVSG